MTKRAKEPESLDAYKAVGQALGYLERHEDGPMYRALRRADSEYRTARLKGDFYKLAEITVDVEGDRDKLQRRHSEYKFLFGLFCITLVFGLSVVLLWPQVLHTVLGFVTVALSIFGIVNNRRYTKCVAVAHLGFGAVGALADACALDIATDRIRRGETDCYCTWQERVDG